MEDGITAYDDATDQWYRFDTTDQMQEHIKAMTVPIMAEREQANLSVESFVMTLTSGSTAPAIQLIGADPNRQRITVSLAKTSAESTLGVLIGNRETVKSNNGFMLINGNSETFHINCELWCVQYTPTGGTSGTPLYVSVLSERS